MNGNPDEYLRVTVLDTQRRVDDISPRVAILEERTANLASEVTALRRELDELRVIVRLAK